MFGIGLPEMILILALALIVVGPDKLPDLARSLAKGILELKKTAEGLKASFAQEGNPLDEIRPELEDAAKSLKGNLLDSPASEWRQEAASGVNPSVQAAPADAGKDIDAEFTTVTSSGQPPEPQTDGPLVPPQPETGREKPETSGSEPQHGQQ